MKSLTITRRWSSARRAVCWSTTLQQEKHRRCRDRSSLAFVTPEEELLFSAEDFCETKPASSHMTASCQLGSAAVVLLSLADVDEASGGDARRVLLREASFSAIRFYSNISLPAQKDGESSVSFLDCLSDISPILSVLLSRSVHSALLYETSL